MKIRLGIETQMEKNRNSQSKTISEMQYLCSSLRIILFLCVFGSALSILMWHFSLETFCVLCIGLLCISPFLIFYKDCEYLTGNELIWKFALLAPETPSSAAKCMKVDLISSGTFRPTSYWAWLYPSRDRDLYLYLWKLGRYLVLSLYDAWFAN